jgi:RNA polymerase sigma-70 factor (ECF subfamily)
MASMNSPGEELDELTLSRARRGDRRALARLIDCYGERVHALVWRMMTGQPELREAAEDICQEALLKVIRALPRFDPSGPAKLSTWILTIAARTCIDELRRRRPVAPLDVEPVGKAETPEGQLQGQELARRVERAMASLPAEQRGVLVLRAYHDLDYPEIAEALGLQLGTVKSRLARARLALRQLVSIENEDAS